MAPQFHRCEPLPQWQAITTPKLDIVMRECHPLLVPVTFFVQILLETELSYFSTVMESGIMLRDSAYHDL